MKIKTPRKIIKQNPFTHEKINVDKILKDIKQSKRAVKKAKKDFEEATNSYKQQEDWKSLREYTEPRPWLLSQNYKPKKKINYYKLTFKVLDILAMILGYLGIATILATVAVLWMVK